MMSGLSRSDDTPSSNPSIGDIKIVDTKPIAFTVVTLKMEVLIAWMRRRKFYSIVLCFTNINETTRDSDSK